MLSSPARKALRKFREIDHHEPALEVHLPNYICQGRDENLLPTMLDHVYVVAAGLYNMLERSQLPTVNGHHLEANELVPVELILGRSRQT
jgi:hypothetical protein